MQNIKGVTKQHFNSINSFVKYISETPVNEVFKESERLDKLRSVTVNKKFSGTKSYEEALELLQTGWSEMAQQIEGELKKVKDIATKKSITSEYSVVGGNVSVARYLQGVPTNMINQKLVTKKQPVVTLNKTINYNRSITTEQIIKESIEALKLVKQYEAQGTRVNLNLIQGLKTNKFNHKHLLTIKLKSANERLNISKLAFPLVHPSMLRRLCFRWIEVAPEIVDHSIVVGYGKPMNDDQIKKLLPKNEILIPTFNANK